MVFNIRHIKSTINNYWFSRVGLGKFINFITTNFYVFRLNIICGWLCANPLTNFHKTRFDLVTYSFKIVHLI